MIRGGSMSGNRALKSKVYVQIPAGWDVYTNLLFCLFKTLE